MATGRRGGHRFAHPSPVPHAPDLSGRALDGRYELHAVIGEGAFGRVYRGRDRRLDRPVAVKVIKPWWTEDPEWSEMFERETQLLARLDDPGIVRIFDVGHAAEGLYFVSELVAGEDLSARLRRGPLAPAQACDLAARLCAALARAHAQRIVHRDVKPANILLCADGAVKVGDFGVARLAEGSTDGAASIVGTPRYMAPEQGRGLPTTPATDVYSVGVVLYEMLAGEPPFPAGTVVQLALAHIQAPPPPLPATVSAPLAVVVARALAKDPGARYADGAAMAEALQSARRAPTPRRRPRSLAARSLPARSQPAARPRATPRVGSGALVAAGVASAGQRGSGHPPLSLDRRSGHLADRLRGVPVPDRTRHAPVRGPRRTVNPPQRRRAAAALGLVLALLAAMVAGALLLAPSARPRAPIAARHSRPPVTLPAVAGDSLTDAQRSLVSLGLRTTTRQVPAPAMAPGTVTAQLPGAGRTAPAGATVTLSVAEVPVWRTAATFTARGSSPPTPVAIRGQRWRIVYRMAYRGTCSWILFCEGPSARVIDLADGRTVARFGLSDGGSRSQVLATGPGRYAVQVTPGGDTATWSVAVEDLF